MAGPHYATQMIFEKQTEAILAVALTPDAKTLVTGGRDKKVKVWDVKSGRLLKTLEGHTDWVFAIAISPDGNTIVSGSRDFTTRAWDLSTGKCLREYNGAKEGVRAVLFTSDGKRIITGSDDDEIYVWDFHTGAMISKIQATEGYVLSLAFTPNEKRLIAGCQSGAIVIFNFATGQIERKIKAHGPWVTTLCVTPDGKWVLSGSLDYKAFLWDISTGAKVRDFIGHHMSVYSAQITPDGKHSFLGTSEKVVEIADLATGHVIRKLTGHQDKVSAITLSKDGNVLATGSEDCTVRAWRNDTKEWEFAVHKKFDSILAGGNEKVGRKDRKAEDDFKQALVVAEELGDLELQAQVKIKIKDFEALKKQFEKEEHERRAQESRKREEEILATIEKAMKDVKYQPGNEQAFLKEFQGLRDQLNKARIHYAYERADALNALLTQRIQEIQHSIIKRIVLTLGTRYNRLLMVEIAEKCEVADIDLTTKTVLEMIKDHEIAAEYFSSSKTVVFDQAANNDALTKFIKDLDAEFQGWNTSIEKKKT